MGVAWTGCRWSIECVCCARGKGEQGGEVAWRAMSGGKGGNAAEADACSKCTCAAASTPPSPATGIALAGAAALHSLYSLEALLIHTITHTRSLACETVALADVIVKSEDLIKNARLT